MKGKVDFSKAASLEARFHSEVVAAASVWLDQKVKEKGYDNIVSCVSYLQSGVPQFRAEAQAASDWRDAVYSTLYKWEEAPPEGVVTIEQAIERLPQPVDFGWQA